MICFEINGKPADVSASRGALTEAILQRLRARLREVIGSIRDPDTGEVPTIVIRCDSPHGLYLHVEGSSVVRALVRKRMLRDLTLEGALGDEMSTTPPQAFLSYGAEDADLAEGLATALQENGIDTWWDRWCITSGDSLRQKIDEGIDGCTHFLVLLTPDSINKPWLNQEMDAGLVRKLQSRCHFIPVRHKLPPKDLPPLLAGMHAPEITTDEEVVQLINDIHGVSRKPALGAHPRAQAAVDTVRTGYSAAANVIARYFVRSTKHGCFGDPIIDVEPLAEQVGLTVDDTKDALYELSSFLKVANGHVLVDPALFSEFDSQWQPWNPCEDALKLAADIMNDATFPADSEQVAALYGWEPRRLNPAVNYLFERDLLRDYRALGHPDYELFRIVGKPDELRRFLKSRG